MYRFSSEQGQELAVRHARSLTRHSEGRVHSYVTVDPHDEQGDHGHYRMETIFSIFSAFLVDSLCWTVFIPIFPAFFRPQYGYLSVGLLFAMKPFAQLWMTLPALYLVNNLGPKTPQLFGSLLLALALALTTFGFFLKNIFEFEHLYFLMLTMRFVHGCGSAMLLMGGLSHVTMCHPSHLRGFSTMMVRSGSIIGLFLGPPFGGWMVHLHGDLESEKHENNHLWILFAFLFSLASSCVAYQLIFFHNGHSVYVNDVSDGDQIGLDVSRPSHFDGTVSINLQSSLNRSDFQYEHKQENDKCSSCLPRWDSINFVLHTPSLCVVIFAGMCGGIAVGSLELLLPTFFCEEFGYNPFHQSLYYILVPFGYSFFSMCSSYYADYGTRYKVLACGLYLLSAGFFLFFGVAKSVSLVGLNLFYIGGCLGVIEMCILPLAHDILDWLDMIASVGTFEISEAALLLGLSIGPFIGGSASMSVGGGIWGFRLSTLLVGIIALVVGFGVLWVLPNVGRVAGDSAMELEGSLFGVHALRGVSGGDDSSAVYGERNSNIKHNSWGSFGSSRSSNNSEDGSFHLKSSLLSEKDSSVL